ncbi:DUF1127 domain-containing protein [Roseibium litorale]|uniref:DUF1127 domain-containing protein n=1 Tax=Roseibium litorale TaxID=2803841 RepID=A0ABR9CNY5_9HYPH|nr:DUF1127 domain-containing protein [Roseibium litorale]MBD8892443.1 DUF1127 domain-containing protein [Roseibium litorale]
MMMIHERTATAGSFFRPLFNAVLFVGKALESYARRRATMRSLARLSERDLQDIGLRRTSAGYELMEGTRRNPRQR